MKSENERNLLAVSIKHTEYRWKYGKPCTLWGYKRTQDNEKRCFSGYTGVPSEAELYSLRDWRESGYGDIVKMDEPVKVTIDFCKKWRKYDTVLVEYEHYLDYCRFAGLRI